MKQIRLQMLKYAVFLSAEITVILALNTNGITQLNSDLVFKWGDNFSHIVGLRNILNKTN